FLVGQVGTAQEQRGPVGAEISRITHSRIEAGIAIARAFIVPRTILIGRAQQADIGAEVTLVEIEARADTQWRQQLHGDIAIELAAHSVAAQIVAEVAPRSARHSNTPPALATKESRRPVTLF